MAIPCGQNASHTGNHLCRMNSHLCGEPCDLVILKLPNKKSFMCSETCHVPKNDEHTVHVCEQRHCPVSCEICKRPCNGDHLHGLIPDQNHHCGQEDSCSTSSSTSQYTKALDKQMAMC
ncbi:hypothetical protein BJV78DRAFT_524572 [Lactifluus subvellereus]|nr:hypothetical protein BJV78DRAFT_524572 [Lactifluus subvellereus]